MPTPARTSLDEIVLEARRVMETRGLEALSMKEVAEAVGVKAPSLYKHVTNRAELLGLIVESAVSELREALEFAVSGSDPEEDLAAIVRAFRAFAHSYPESYRLIFTPMMNEWHPERDALVAAVAPVLRTTAALAGPDHALEGARLITAWAHGFMTMELAGAFQMDGDVDDAFEYGVDRLRAALKSR